MSTQSAQQRTASRGTVNAYEQAQQNRARTPRPEGKRQDGRPSWLIRGTVALGMVYMLVTTGPVIVCRVLLWVHGL